MKLKYFANKAQLIRYVSEESGKDIDVLWDEYDDKIE